MAKTSKDQILLDENKVLDSLEQHSKDSVDEIAKSCGFSRQKVWRIIKDLEKRKIIWGYTAVTDEKAKNLKHFTLLVKRTNIPLDDDIRKEVSFDKIDSRIINLIKIENIYTTHGIADFIFTFYAPDIISAKKFVSKLFSRHNTHIKECFILETLLPIRIQGFKNPQIKDLVHYI